MFFLALDAGRAHLDSEVATKVAAGLTGLSNGFGAGGNSEIRQCQRACRYSRYFMCAPVCMSDEARIRELVALIDAEKDPQKVKKPRYRAGATADRKPHALARSGRTGDQLSYLAASPTGRSSGRTRRSAV
jgi:hypothetical protein